MDRPRPRRRAAARAALLALLVAVAMASAPGMALRLASARPSPGVVAEQPSLERVEFSLAPDLDPALAEALVIAAGGRLEVHAGGRLQALVPAGRVAPLAATPGLRLEPPAVAVPLQVATASGLVGADIWRQVGFTGHGVRVAVIDTGFAGYESQLGTSLPVAPTTRSFRSDGRLDAGTNHGTLAAQIVHELAPGAELYLLNFSTVTELAAAVEFAIAEDVDIVSFSVGFVHNGPGDGTGPVDAVVSRATNAGLLWVVAAGNWAEQHWAGRFRDNDGDSIHEFGASELNGRRFDAGDLIIASLRWDDVWGAACSDYDLELFGPEGDLVASSRGLQACNGNPVETLQVLATRPGEYSVRVIEAGSDRPRQLDLLLLSSPDRSRPLDRFVTGGSIAQPADHPAALSVGALTVGGIAPLSLTSFSSRGPTTDGRAKPEITSPTGTSSASQTSFAGTSAAAPHVAAGAALLAEAFGPGTDGSTLKAQLLARSLLLDPGEPNPSEQRHMLQLGSTLGFGPLLPPGGSEAVLAGGIPEQGGLAALRYDGPSRYPLRFIHLLTGPAEALALFRFDLDTFTWDRHIVGAPSWVNTFDSLQNGDLMVIRFRTP